MDRFLGISNCFILFLLIHHCVGPPTKNKENAEAPKPDHAESHDIDDLGLEYNRYLKEIVDTLESDHLFKQKLEAAQEADFRNGKVAAELEYVNHQVRTKLDELKRTELERLRDLIHKQKDLETNEINPNHVNPGHLDHSNPHTFETADLQKLINQVRKDLVEVDRKRREEFKEYEMQKKFEEEQKMKAMDEEHKKGYLEDLEKEKKKHQQHEPLDHPGSKAHLEAVWKDEDHMGDQKFNPRTFFMLHDINGDGYWDEEEVKALFVKELNKLYQPGAGDDMREREEEMERMREHVFKETDTNGDRLLSYEELLEQTKKQEFNKNEGWETIDQQPQFSQQEYEEFEHRRQAEIQRLIDSGQLQPYPQGMPPHPPYGQHPAQYQQQYHPGAPQQYGHQGMQPQYVPQGQQYGGPQYAAHHPNQIPQHPGMHNNQPPQVQSIPSPHQPAPPHPNEVPSHIKPDNQQIPQYHNQAPIGQNIPQQQGNQVPSHIKSGFQDNQQIPQYHNQAPIGQNIPQQGNQVPSHIKPGLQDNQQIPQYQNQAPIGHIPIQQGNQVPQNINSQPQQNINQASAHSQSSQQYQHDPNQIVATNSKSNNAPQNNQQNVPNMNQNTNQQVPIQQQHQIPQGQAGQVPSQGVYGSQQASYQQNSAGQNQPHPDNAQAKNIPNH